MKLLINVAIGYWTISHLAPTSKVEKVVCHNAMVYSISSAIYHISIRKFMPGKVSVCYVNCFDAMLSSS